MICVTVNIDMCCVLRVLNSHKKAEVHKSASKIFDILQSLPGILY